MVCDCMDVLILFGIIVDETRTSWCYLSMIFSMILLDEKCIALSTTKVKYDLSRITSYESG